MKIKIHPLFWVLVAITIFFGDGISLLWTFLAVFCHETGHILVARTRGYLMKSMVLMPYGAVMSGRESFDDTSSVLIGLAGPVTNLILALVTLGVWWIFPSCYLVTRPFFHANLSLAFFNLLPAAPLDGARVMMGLSKNKLRALRGLKIVGIVISILFLGLFILSCFYGVNFSLVTVSIFLFYGAVMDNSAEHYVSVFSPVSKDYDLGVERRHVVVSKDMPLQRLLRFTGRNNLVTFEVLDTDVRFDEGELKDMALVNKLSTPVGEILFQKDKRK